MSKILRVKINLWIQDERVLILHDSAEASLPLKRQSLHMLSVLSSAEIL